MLAWQKVHICMPNSQPTDYIVYSVREKTCTREIVLFISRIIIKYIGQQGICSFILHVYTNQTDTKRFVHDVIFCDFACF